MFYRVNEDIKLIREMLNMTQEVLAEKIGVERRTVLLSENGETEFTVSNCNKLYNYAFEKDIHLNKIKAMLYKEEMYGEHVLLIHGSKSGINGKISPFYGRKSNDFGYGFYCGESYDQPVSLISQFKNPIMYLLDFNTKNLKSFKFDVNKDWMLAIAYFRGTLNNYSNHPIIQNTIKKLRGIDYIIAPIADNRMFNIIDTFISGEITDEQCKHCLAATNLGYQYVLLSERSTSNLTVLEKCFVCDKEREYYQKQKENDSKIGDEKVKMARIKYKGVGQYIDELLK